MPPIYHSPSLLLFHNPSLGLGLMQVQLKAIELSRGRWIQGFMIAAFVLWLLRSGHVDMTINEILRQIAVVVNIGVSVSTAIGG